MSFVTSGFPGRSSNAWGGGGGLPALLCKKQSPGEVPAPLWGAEAPQQASGLRPWGLTPPTFVPTLVLLSLQDPPVPPGWIFQDLRSHSPPNTPLLPLLLHGIGHSAAHSVTRLRAATGRTPDSLHPVMIRGGWWTGSPRGGRRARDARQFRLRPRGGAGARPAALLLRLLGASCRPGASLGRASRVPGAGAALPGWRPAGDAWDDQRPLYLVAVEPRSLRRFPHCGVSCPPISRLVAFLCHIGPESRRQSALCRMTLHHSGLGGLIWTEQRRNCLPRGFNRRGRG